MSDALKEWRSIAGNAAAVKDRAYHECRRMGVPSERAREIAGDLIRNGGHDASPDANKAGASCRNGISGSPSTPARARFRAPFPWESDENG